MNNNKKCITPILALVIIVAIILISGICYSLSNINKTNVISKSDSRFDEVTAATYNEIAAPIQSSTTAPSYSGGTPPAGHDLKKTLTFEDFYYTKDEINYTVDCGNEGCFEERFTSCQPSSMSADANFTSVKYMIVGKRERGCDVLFTYTKYPDPAWVNKEMTCEFDNTMGFEKSLAQVFADATIGDAKCEGPLSDILHSKVQ